MGVIHASFASCAHLRLRSDVGGHYDTVSASASVTWPADGSVVSTTVSVGRERANVESGEEIWIASGTRMASVGVISCSLRRHRASSSGVDAVALDLRLRRLATLIASACAVLDLGLGRGRGHLGVDDDVSAAYVHDRRIAARSVPRP